MFIYFWFFSTCSEPVDNMTISDRRQIEAPSIYVKLAVRGIPSAWNSKIARKERNSKISFFFS